ncbi:MAG: hypothetical protein ACJAQS_000094 [Porticoccus sp.]|jgi:hypothetical protein
MDGRAITQTSPEPDIPMIFSAEIFAAFNDAPMAHQGSLFP